MLKIYKIPSINKTIPLIVLKCTEPTKFHKLKTFGGINGSYSRFFQYKK